MIYIETDRLLLRSWKEEDRKHLKLINQDLEVMTYLGSPLTEDETDYLIEKIKQELREENYGVYAVELKENKKFIGIVGLHRTAFVSDFTPCIEILWRLDRNYWNKGYATEAAKACINYAFNTLKIDEVHSFTSKLNKASIKVMENIGLKFIKEFNHPDLKPDDPLRRHVLYRIERI